MATTKKKDTGQAGRRRISDHRGSGNRLDIRPTGEESRCRVAAAKLAPKKAAAKKKTAPKKKPAAKRRNKASAANLQIDWYAAQFTGLVR